MGIFPDRKIPRDAHGTTGAEAIFGDKLKDASDEQVQAANKVLDYIKLGHQIIKAVVQSNKSEADRISDIVVARIQATDWDNKAERAALVSVLLTAATAISPTTYGEDFEKWVDDDKSN